MALVHYEDSDDDDDRHNHQDHQDHHTSHHASQTVGTTSPISHTPSTNANAPALKRKRNDPEEKPALPPLPASFHDLYSTNTRVSTRDDPSLHGGRKRSIPHVEGNWATHVYLEWHPSQTESNTLSTLISLLQTSQPKNASTPVIQPLLQSPLGAPLPLHISLSRSLILQSPQREPFLATLTLYIRKSSVRPFSLKFTSLKWISNFEHTRWFLVLGIAKPDRDELNRLLNASNQAAAVFGLPSLYTNNKGKEAEGIHTGRKKGSPQRTRDQHSGTARADSESVPLDRSEAFHISIAWVLNEPGSDSQALLQNAEVVGFIEKEVGEMAIGFSVVKAKIGNAISVIGLDSKVVDEKGILG